MDLDISILRIILLRILYSTAYSETLTQVREQAQCEISTYFDNEAWSALSEMVDINIDQCSHVVT